MFRRLVHLAFGAVLCSLASVSAGLAQPAQQLRDVLTACDCVVPVLDTRDAFAFGVTCYLDDGPDDDVDVVVTCRGMTDLATMTCDETPLREWARLSPALSNAGLLARAAADAQRIRGR